MPVTPCSVYLVSSRSILKFELEYFYTPKLKDLERDLSEKPGFTGVRFKFRTKEKKKKKKRGFFWPKSAFKLFWSKKLVKIGKLFGKLQENIEHLMSQVIIMDCERDCFVFEHKCTCQYNGKPKMRERLTSRSQRRYQICWQICTK